MKCLAASSKKLIRHSERSEESLRVLQHHAKKKEGFLASLGMTGIFEGAFLRSLLVQTLHTENRYVR